MQIIDTSFVAQYIRVYMDCGKYASLYELIVNGTAFHYAAYNAAFGKKVSATSYEAGTTHIPSNITDGNLSTRWGAHISNPSDPVNITVDLGEELNLNDFVIYWESTNGQYIIESATNADGPWHEVCKNESPHSEGGFGASVRFYNGNGQKARYIRIHGSLESFFSIYELIVVKPLENLAMHKKTMASSTERAYVSSNANDGLLITRWSGFNTILAPFSHNTYDWWQVDLGASYNLHQIGLYWENHSMRDYYVAVSENADGPWTRVLSNDEAMNTLADVSCTARFVRVYMTRETYHSLTEVQVFGE